jgi:hypothetical protein
LPGACSQLAGTVVSGMRWSGLAEVAEASAQITELAVDDHACLTFGEQGELFDLTAAFVRDGLADGLQVVWLSDAGPAATTGSKGTPTAGKAAPWPAEHSHGPWLVEQIADQFSIEHGPAGTTAIFTLSTRQPS